MCRRIVGRSPARLSCESEPKAKLEWKDSAAARKISPRRWPPMGAIAAGMVVVRTIAAELIAAGMVAAGAITAENDCNTAILRGCSHFSAACIGESDCKGAKSNRCSQNGHGVIGKNHLK